MGGLGHFYSHRAALVAGQFAATLEAGVGSLKSFHRQYRAIFHDHGLADFQPADFLGDALSKLDVGLYCGRGFWPEAKAGAGHGWLEPGRGLHQGDALPGQFFGDAESEYLYNRALETLATLLELDDAKMRDLRKKIDAGREPLLHTVRGVGYMLRSPR